MSNQNSLQQEPLQQKSLYRQSLQELRLLVASARGGDADSYDAIVRRFQDMAVGYGYSLLGDFGLAEDAAQEAFIEAAACLHALREPEAFGSWLRTIVFKHCDRMKRRKRVPTEALGAALEIPALESGPCHRAEVEALKAEVRSAIQALPEHERIVTLLFYISEYSQAEIGEFLGLPVTTVKKRLYDARQRLKQRMITAMTEELHEQRPSKDEEFVKRLHEMMSAIETGDSEKVREFLHRDPALLNAKGFYYMAGDEAMTPLFVATNFNQQEIALLLLNKGADPHAAADGQRVLHLAAFHRNREMADALIAHGMKMDIFTAAGLGDASLLREFLAEDPSLVSVRSSRGETPLHMAGNIEVAKALLEAGADIEARDDHYGNTPAESMPHVKHDIVRFLIDRGAKVNFPLACAMGDVAIAGQLLKDDPALASTPCGPCRPESNTLPLSIACVYGQLPIVAFLCDAGVDVNAPNELRGDATALHFAARSGHYDIVMLLLQRDANPQAVTRNNKSPLHWALHGQREKWGEWSGNPHPPRHQEVIELLRQNGVSE